MNKPMIPDWQQALVFVEKIAGRANPKMTFQVFDDKAKDYHLASWKYGRLSDPTVKRWISSKVKQGCGIYVTISECDGTGRRRKNVMNARACFIDLDGEPLPDDSDWKIKPDIIVETSPGKYHCYWLIQNLQDLNLFSDTQAMLAARFGADPRVFDPSRVLRLPGFYHQKARPVRSKTLFMSDRDPSFDRIDIHELRNAYPADYTPPATRAEGGRSEEPESGWDNPADIDKATAYLKAIKVPAPGDRNNQGYRVAARLNDYAISPGKSEELMGDIWNPRLSNPLKHHEIAHVVNSAGRYKASSAGSASAGNAPTAEEEFDDDFSLDDAQPIQKTKEKPAIDAAEPDFEGQPLAKVEQFDFGTSAKPKTVRHNLNGMSYSSMDEIVAEKLEWLWQDRIPLGKVTIFAGYPDQGKSQILLKCAAVVSNGGEWPNDEGTAEQGVAVILSSEDDEADTLKPRAAAAGANMKNMYVIQSMVTEVKESGRKTRRVFNIEDDLAKLTLLVKKFRAEGRVVRFIGIDPINAYFGGAKKGDSHKTADMRALLTPLAEWAARTRIAIVCISHFNKGANSHTLYRITDSSAITAAARSVYVTVRTNADKPNDAPERLFVSIKHNLAKDSIKGLTYSMVSTPVGHLTGIEGQEMPHIIFGGTSDMTADEALGGLGTKAGPKSDARDKCAAAVIKWFEDDSEDSIVEGGAITVKRLRERCRDLGFAYDTMLKAMRDLRCNYRGRPGAFPIVQEWQGPGTAPIPDDELPADDERDFEDTPAMDRGGYDFG